MLLSVARSCALGKRGKREMRQGVAIVSVRLPRPVVDWLDKLAERGIYKSRSEAVREFVRSYVLSALVQGGARARNEQKEQ